MKALRIMGGIGKTVFKLLAVGFLLMGHFIMNAIGAIVCAVTNG